METTLHGKEHHIPLSRHLSYNPGGGGKCSRNRAANMVVLHPLVHFPPHLHGHTPALHGRETVAHGAVAAIGRGLGNVRLRQISPHGRRFLWLHT